MCSRVPSVNKILFFSRSIPPIWLAAFLYFAMKGNSDAPPPNLPLFALVASGTIYHLVYSQALVRRRVAEYRGLLGSILAVALAILVSECNAQFAGLAPPHALPRQVALLLCIPALMLFLLEPRHMAWVVGLFAAVCAWNFFMMPIEAVWGAKVSWHTIYLTPREAGPFKYQAAGLAIAAFYFPGFMLGLFYLAWGPVFQKRVFAQAGIPRGLMVAMPVLWLIPVICVQSRSALAGALAAALLLLASQGRARNLLVWASIGLLAAAGAAFYWYLFTEGKSGADLRIAYLKFYISKSLDWNWLATGRSFYYDPKLIAPGWQALDHSHNDFVQVLYSWGLVTLIAYLAFWAALLRLIYSRFLVHKEYWPLAALVAVLPSMQTDLGLHHFEKTMFLVILTSFCVVFSEWDAQRRQRLEPSRPEAEPQPAPLPQPVSVRP
jgi:hypothetical protein